MKRLLCCTLSVATIAMLALVALALMPATARAQSIDVCYGVADNGGVFGQEDALVTLDRNTGITTLIGRTGTNNIEAIAFAPGGGNLYAANAGRLGILSLTTGAFTQVGSSFGTGSGAIGDVSFSDVDGLSYDAGSGILYGTHRLDGADRDLLIQIDRTTGAHVPDAFGPGVDYVVIDGPGVLGDVDDIAVDPITGVMYGGSNDGGVGGVLITINKSTGAGAAVAAFGVDDIEGFAYFNDGQLYGSTGKDGNDPSTRNQLYRINETTAVATLVAPFSDFRDYEALDCLTGPTSVSLAGVSASGATSMGLWLVGGLAALAAMTLVALRRQRWQPSI